MEASVKPPRPSAWKNPDSTIEDAHRFSGAGTYSAASRSGGLSETDKSHDQTKTRTSPSIRPVHDFPCTRHRSLKRTTSGLIRDTGIVQLYPRGTSGSSPVHAPQDSFDFGLGIHFDRQVTDNPAKVPVEASLHISRPLAQPHTPYPELDRYRNFPRPGCAQVQQQVNAPPRLSTHDLAPSTPGSILYSAGSIQTSVLSGSPSTGFSGSPGIGSCSRDTTPTSVSDQSSILVPPSFAVTAQQNLCQPHVLTARPPITTRRAGGLFNEMVTDSIESRGPASVNESLTSSSSSNSTAKDAEQSTKREKTKQRELPPISPSPPPRVSSKKFCKPKEGDFFTLAKTRHSRYRGDAPVDVSKRMPNLSATGHHTSPPVRPSRANTLDMKSQFTKPTPVIQSNLSTHVRAAERVGSSSMAIIFPGSSNSSFAQRRKSSSIASSPARFGIGGISIPKVQGRQMSLTKPDLASPAVQAKARSSPRTRFPFFARKLAMIDGHDRSGGKPRKEKIDQKGPVAGTGNEGYSRTGTARRRGGKESGSSASMFDPLVLPDRTATLDSFSADRTSRTILSAGEVMASRHTGSDGTHSELVQPRTDLKFLPEDTSVSRSPLNLPFEAFVSDSSRKSTDNATCGATLHAKNLCHTDLQREHARKSSPMHPVPRKLRNSPRSTLKWNLRTHFSTQSTEGRDQKNNGKDEERARVTAAVKTIEKRRAAYYTILDVSDQDAEKFSDFSDVSVYAIGKQNCLQTAEKVSRGAKSIPEYQSPQSFSRPFQVSLQPAAKSATTVYDPKSIATGPVLPDSFISLPDLPKGDAPEASAADSSSNQRPGLGTFARTDGTNEEFLSLYRRKNSTGTINTISSSSGGPVTFLAATAIIPEPDDPPAEDEIWDEFDDILGEDSIGGIQTAILSSEMSLHSNDLHIPSGGGSKPGQPLTAMCSYNKSTSLEASIAPTSSNADMTVRSQVASRKRDSDIDLMADHAESDRQSVTRHSDERNSTAFSCHTAFSDDISRSSDIGSPLAQVNLRVGSMTVSKWLTFGHVLFSEIRHELTPVNSPLSILMVDGLGNDDWSFYAAETYPGAIFYNLSPRAPLGAALKKSWPEHPSSPPNHRQMQYSSHMAEFPISAQSIDAVVYRFPTAAPEFHYRNILSEARRVLKPNGHIELSILDSDLNHMGHQGRRAIRRLKENIRLKTPEASLGSTADFMTRHLDKFGFSGIKAARVGVPVANSITRSGSRGLKGKQDTQERPGHPSLADMMNDDSSLADENITKIVSQVGRWWYTCCYERAAGFGQDNSMWRDEDLVSECEKLGTSLKLMVCCARAPSQ